MTDETRHQQEALERHERARRDAAIREAEMSDVERYNAREHEAEKHEAARRSGHAKAEPLGGPHEPHDPQLGEKEKKKADEEESLDAPTTHEVIRRQGEKELKRSASALAWSALAAGLAMGLTLVAEAALRSHLPDAPWRPLVTKLGYAVGFLAVILGSQQLYTENTLMPIVPFMTRRTGRMARRVGMLWLVVLIGNLLGAFLFALAAAHTDAFKPELREAFTEIGKEALAGPFWTIFVRGVIAGWIIALMVWMLPAAQTAQIAVITVMAWLVGIGGFAHIIVGSVETLYLVLTGDLTFGGYFTRFMIPALLGNTIGGVILVALLNHQQVKA